MKTVRRPIRALAGLVAVVGLLLGPAAPAHAETTLTPGALQQLAEGLLTRGVRLPPCEMISMTTGEVVDADFIQVVGHANQVIDLPFSDFVALATAGAADGVTYEGEGSVVFASDSQQTHVFVLEYDQTIDGIDIAELGIGFVDAGGNQLADPDLPFAPTTGTSRGVARVQGGGSGGSIYYTVDGTGSVEVFANGFFIARYSSERGTEVVVVGGPISPEFVIYTSGAKDVSVADPDVLAKLVGWRSEVIAPNVTPMSLDDAMAVTSDVPVDGDQDSAPPVGGGSETDVDAAGDDDSAYGDR